MENTKLNAPFIANNMEELQNISWLISEWLKAQTNSPAIAGNNHDDIRSQFSSMAGELQTLQAELAMPFLMGNTL